MDEGNEMLTYVSGVGQRWPFPECLEGIIGDTVFWNYMSVFIGLECLSIVSYPVHAESV